MYIILIATTLILLYVIRRVRLLYFQNVIPVEIQAVPVLDINYTEVPPQLPQMPPTYNEVVSPDPARHLAMNFPLPDILEHPIVIHRIPSPDLEFTRLFRRMMRESNLPQSDSDSDSL